jgi:hypothetical protein
MPTLNPKHERYAARLRQLIAEADFVIRPEHLTKNSEGYFIKAKAPLQAWLAKVHNIIESVFAGGPYPRLLEKAGTNHIEYAHHLERVLGLLQGALDDLENGYLIGQEFLLAADIFDSVLDQARHLNNAGHKDPAAVLTRVVLEDALRRMARQESISDGQKASSINDALKASGRLTQPQWRLVQAWLDIGNAAAHGNFTEYDHAAVARLIEDVERFIAMDFRA